MQIKDLISQLQELYNTYDDEYKSVMGEPEIMMDVFEFIDNSFWTYQGFSPNFVIEKSNDGVYDILSTFYEDHYQNQETTESPGDSLPWPQSWET